MAIEVIIPAMGESISSGILAAWHVQDGQYVEKDQVLYELETDKITSERNAEVAGVIKILIAADEEVEIGQVVATIDETAAAQMLLPQNKRKKTKRKFRKKTRKA